MSLEDELKKIDDEIAEENKAQEKISLYDEYEKKKSQATLLIEIGQQGKLFHCNSGDAYTEIMLNDVKATLKIRSREYKEYLSHKLYKLTDKGANSNAISDAIATLEASAKYSGDEIIVAVRTFYSGENIFIDTGCKDRKIISIDQSGWSYATDAPIKFTRKNGMTALPEPENNGSIDLLKKYLNVSEYEFPLVYGWIFCAIAGVKPYPILILQGEQGTGKSTTSKVIRSLVDPSAVLLRSPPKDTRDLLVSAANNHTVVLDNLSGINAEMSDCLCRLSTGGGHDVRALFTDDEQYLIELQKPVLCNGIDDVATRPDLAQRACIINLPIITDQNRKSEEEFWKSFRADMPLIMGAILSALSSGLRHRESITLTEKPRMADVAHWVTACERELGLEGDFLSAHKENQLHAIELGIDASPAGVAIMTLMAERQSWVGKPTELFNVLTDIAGDRQTRSKAWPQSTKGLNNIIKRLTPSFRAINIDINKSISGNREYEIRNLAFYPPYPPYPPETMPYKGCSQGGYKTQAPDMAVNRPDVADRKSNRQPPTTYSARPVADKALKAVKSQEFLLDDNEEEF